MEKYLIVDSKRPWVDRESIVPGDRVIAHHENTGEDYRVIFDIDVWYVENHEATRVHDFKDLFATFGKGWKFFKLAETEQADKGPVIDYGAFINEIIGLSDNELQAKIKEIRQRIDERLEKIDEPILCASCGQFTVAKEGELCYACGHP